jgi:hypothetical protein
VLQCRCSVYIVEDDSLQYSLHKFFIISYDTGPRLIKPQSVQRAFIKPPSSEK